MADPAHNGRIVTEPVKLSSDMLLSPAHFMSAQVPFFITEADYGTLKSGIPRQIDWAHNIFLAGVGVFFTALGKLLHGAWQSGWPFTDIFKRVDGVEYFSMAITIVVSALFYGYAYFFLPNKREELLKKIGKHFESSPSKIHAVQYVRRPHDQNQ